MSDNNIHSHSFDGCGWIWNWTSQAGYSVISFKSSLRYQHTGHGQWWRQLIVSVLERGQQTSQVCIVINWLYHLKSSLHQLSYSPQRPHPRSEGLPVKNELLWVWMGFVREIIFEESTSYRAWSMAEASDCFQVWKKVKNFSSSYHNQLTLSLRLFATPAFLFTTSGCFLGCFSTSETLTSVWGFACEERAALGLDAVHQG